MARTILIAAFADVQVLDVTGPAAVFQAAAQARPDHGYRVMVAGAKAGSLPTNSGMSIVAERSFSRVRGPVDTLIVPGGDGPALTEASPAIGRLIAREAPRARRIASVCTGSFLLAEAGLLDGLRATTHWEAAAQFARRYPKVLLEPDAIWTQDGHTFTSAGVTAGIDLALALVEQDLGTPVAMQVARRLVVYLKRPGGQSQFSTGLRAQTEATGCLQALPAWIDEHLHEDLGNESLARHAGMSPRNFSRVFPSVFGTSPAKYVEQVRVERARALLESDEISVDEVAASSGFAHAERMRRAFLRHLRVSPSEYRERFGPRSSVRRIDLSDSRRKARSA